MKSRFTTIAIASWCFVASAAAWAQQPPADPPRGQATQDPFDPREKPRRIRPAQDSELIQRLEQTLPRLTEIAPTPPKAIPHDPPPHEGAMLDVDLVIAPPDLLRIDVLEALPGRPISGSFLVRPDGTINLEYYGSVHVRGLSPTQAKTKIILHLREWLDDEVLGLVGYDASDKGVITTPAESDRVVVDISAYNSGGYFVLGQVNSPGRLPSTGNETVLHALQYAGDLSPTADRGHIVLHRPARGADSPARTYPIDYDAIVEGRTEANLQIFPGDRIVVGKASQ